MQVLEDALQAVVGDLRQTALAVSTVGARPCAIALTAATRMTTDMHRASLKSVIGRILKQFIDIWLSKERMCPCTRTYMPVRYFTSYACDCEHNELVGILCLLGITKALRVSGRAPACKRMGLVC